MRRRLALLAGICAAGTAAAQLPKMDDLLKGVDKLPKTPVSPLPPGTTDDKTGAAKIQKVADVARAAGYQKQVDEFVLSMNRAAEAAAPLASRYFGDAIRDMTLQDVQGILRGGDTAATDFFSSKTRDKLYAAFKPTVAQKVNEVGATRAYKDMMGRYEKVPLMGSQSLDLDDYVTNKSLDGLFHVVAEEERKIRTNPAARTTDLLKTVFGK